ncbi:MAG: SRPBCC domain-containing protein [Hyphomonadaceae bacterium]|nr:SRPBCC domain-containing protein [Hyphomonadaceae bacterium]
MSEEALPPDHVSRIDSRLAEDPTRKLVMTRRFDASPERVFDAWTRSDLVAKWLFTGPTSETHNVDFAPRVDAKWTIQDRRGGVDYTAQGWFLEVDRPRRLVFTFGMPQFADEYDRIIVELAPDGAGTLMTFTQEGVRATYKDGAEHGWNLMFMGLKQLIETGAIIYPAHFGKPDV